MLYIYFLKNYIIQWVLMNHILKHWRSSSRLKGIFQGSKSSLDFIITVKKEKHDRKNYIM